MLRVRPDRAVALVLEVDGLRRGRGAVGDDLLLPGARARAEAMQRVIEGDADRFATPLTTSLATPAVADDVSMPLTSSWAARVSIPALGTRSIGSVDVPGDPSVLVRGGGSSTRFRRCPLESVPLATQLATRSRIGERRGYFLHRRRRCPIRAEGGGPVGASRRAPTTARSPPALTSL